MAKSITLGKHEFKRKKEAIEFVRTLMFGSVPDIPLNGDDFRVIDDLLKLHPRAEEKIGCGVRDFIPRVNPASQPGRHFEIVRLNGSRDTFSYRTCFYSSLDSNERRFIQACRMLIKPQIFKFKLECFNGSDTIRCPISGEQMVFTDAEVDHIPPDTFDELVKRFVSKEPGIDFDQVEFRDIDGRDIGNIGFRDRGLESRWLIFHLKHARLRVISRFAHLKLSSEQTRKRSSNKKTEII